MHLGGSVARAGTVQLRISKHAGQLLPGLPEPRRLAVEALTAVIQKV